MQSQRLAYNPAFDGLRALAAISVVGFHCGIPIFHNGFIGVDVFFVLSGFLITSILRGEIADTGSIDLWRFYLFRASRLYPPLLLMLVVYLVFAGILWPARQSDANALFAAVYLTDYRTIFVTHSTPVAHTWSLAVEEHFYMVWPFVIWLTRRMERKRLIIVLAICFAVAIIWRMADFYLLSDLGSAKFRTDTRASGLILGSLVAMVGWRPKRAAALISTVSLACFAVLFVRYYPNDTTIQGPMGLGGVYVDVTAAALILSLDSGQSDVSNFLSSAPLVRLGVLSYSIYLWHYMLYFATMGKVVALPDFALVLAASIGIAEISYRFVERPLKDWRRNCAQIPAVTSDTGNNGGSFK